MSSILTLQRDGPHVKRTCELDECVGTPGTDTDTHPSTSLDRRGGWLGNAGMVDRYRSCGRYIDALAEGNIMTEWR